MNFDGAGDRRTYCTSENGSDSPRYIKRKLANGLPVAVYLTEQYQDQPHEDETFEGYAAYETETSKVQLPTVKSSIDILKEYLCCPVCKDPFVQTTATNCGHKFCKQCIDQSLIKKPICPVCSTWITAKYRLYSDDQLIESQLTYLNSDFKQRFEEAQRKRLQQCMEEQQDRKSRIVKKVREKLDDSLIYLRYKNHPGFINKVGSSPKILYSKLSDWSESINIPVVVGVLIGVLLILTLDFLSDKTQFLQYMWLAAQHYNGEIPKQWLQTTTTDIASNRTTFEVFIEYLTFSSPKS